ncbi:hypothetical protein F2Q68_00008805 [Brassica cretica]|uniref:Uncharacterized protein n=1 Tax=Brassica cretica TaxID=69181 RepID=A0A8S9KTB4_BRACR|nr:hypothetical protein F2Q68_00008805 [Brassica cretica]
MEDKAFLYNICTELTSEDIKKLYSEFGLIYPYDHEELVICEDIYQEPADSGFYGWCVLEAASFLI